MTSDATRPYRHASGGQSRPMGFVAPLVSVIIVNYNYGRFLSEAIASVYAQTYQNIECVVVDNNSSDDSLDILDALLLDFPSLKVIRRDTNGGQCAASAEAFPETSGQYIVFLDADDVLFPDFIGTHVYVHLSLYSHVGLTCCDMVQTVGNEVVLSTHSAIKELIRESKPASAPLMRPFDRAACPIDGLVPVAESDLLEIERDQLGWRWTATSAFMFRRDAVALLIENPRFKTLSCALDVYFARGINAITGSIVINRALCVYRLHGSNIFSRHAHLDRFLNFELGGPYDQSAMARRELVDFWFSDAEVLVRKFAYQDDFIAGIQALTDAPPRLKDEASGRSYGAIKLLQHIPRLRRVLPFGTILRWCIRMRVSPFALLRTLVWST